MTMPHWVKITLAILGTAGAAAAAWPAGIVAAVVAGSGAGTAALSMLYHPTPGSDKPTP